MGCSDPKLIANQNTTDNNWLRLRKSRRELQGEWELEEEEEENEVRREGKQENKREKVEKLGKEISTVIILFGNHLWIIASLDMHLFKRFQRYKEH